MTTLIHNVIKVQCKLHQNVCYVAHNILGPAQPPLWKLSKHDEQKLMSCEFQ